MPPLIQSYSYPQPLPLNLFTADTPTYAAYGECLLEQKTGWYEFADDLGTDFFESTMSEMSPVTVVRVLGHALRLAPSDDDRGVLRRQIMDCQAHPTNVHVSPELLAGLAHLYVYGMMRGGHQEDAEEFFGFYLDTLEEELHAILHSISPPKPTKVHVVKEVEEAAAPPGDGWLEVGKRNRMVITRTNKATESLITRIFGGKFRATLRALGQKDSVVIEEWQSLRLDIQPDQIHTIRDALSYISHPQPVHISQPGKPGVTVDGQRQELIEALPPILVMYIKRFFYDPTQGGAVKVGKQVRFGPELEIGADIMVPAARKVQPARYKLFGALYHHGLSASGGHYTLDVLHPNRYPSANPTAKPREGWVRSRINDDLVSDVGARGCLWCIGDGSFAVCVLVL